MLRIADKFAYSLTIASSMIKHFSAGFEVFSARTSQMRKFVRSYCETLIYQDLSCRDRTRKVYGHGVLKEDLALLSKYGLQIQMQGRQFERVTERIENNKL